MDVFVAAVITGCKMFHTNLRQVYKVFMVNIYAIIYLIVMSLYYEFLLCI